MTQIPTVVEIESDALKANLAETAGEVVIEPKLRLLLDIVSGYKGISATLEHLLYEICHPYRNWSLLIPQLRSFCLKNSSYYQRHAQGPEAFTLFTGLFLQALNDSLKKGTLLIQIIEAQLAWVEKLLSLFDASDLQRFGPSLNGYFQQLAAFDQSDPAIMMYITQGQHPMKKLALRLLSFPREIGRASCRERV